MGAFFGPALFGNAPPPPDPTSQVRIYVDR